MARHGGELRRGDRARLRRHGVSWRPQEIDIGGGFPAPRDPTSPTGAAAAPIGEYAHGGRRHARRPSCRTADSTRLGSHSRSSRAARSTPTPACISPRCADSSASTRRWRGRGSRPTPPRCSGRPPDRTRPFPAGGGLPRRPAGTGDCGYRRHVVRFRRARAADRAPGGRGERRDRVSGHRRLPGRLRQQLERAAAPRARCWCMATEAEWIKRPETVDEVFARDLVPERLR